MSLGPNFKIDWEAIGAGLAADAAAGTGIFDGRDIYGTGTGTMGTTGEPPIFLGGRRTSSTGAVFKRELKTSDATQSISDLVVSPILPDVYDGQGLFHNIMEKSVEGNNLAAGEISLGNTYAACDYIIEAPVKRAPTFGAGDLIGLDLNIYHDNLNFNKSHTLPDFEVYKFNREISGLTKGTFGVPETEDVIIGISRYSRESQIVEPFNSEFSSKTGRSEAGYTGEIYMEPRTAYEIAKGEIEVEKDGWVDGIWCDYDTFKERYCINSTKAGGLICKMVSADDIGQNYIRPSQGNKWYRNDPVYIRTAVDYRFCLEQEGQDWWDNNSTYNAMIYVREDVEPKPFTINSGVTSKNSIFEKITQYGNVKASTRDDEGNPQYKCFAKAHFTNESESSSGLAMSTFFDKDATLSDSNSQLVRCTLRLPKPLELAREWSLDDEMNSLEVDVRFSIKSMSKQHISDVGTTNRYGYNMLRSFGMVCSTRAPSGKTEPNGLWFMRMNGTTTAGASAVDSGTQLSAAITNTTDPLASVDEGSGGSAFTAGNIIKIDDEYMLVEDITSNDLTVVRGYQGTTAATHSDNETVYIVPQPTDLTNHTSGQTKNQYNGFAIMRNNRGAAESDDPDEGELKIHWSGLAGSRSAGWGGQLQNSVYTAYVTKRGAGGDTDSITSGSYFDENPPIYHEDLQSDDLDTPALLEGDFYTCKILINYKKSTGDGDVTWIILDNNNDIIATRKQRHSGRAMSAGDSNNLEEGFPKYLTFWVENIDVGKAGELLSTTTGAIYDTAAVDTSVEAIIDNITISGFEPKVANMSTAPLNTNRQAGSISAKSIGAIDTDGTFTRGSPPPIFSGSQGVVPTYISFGTKTDVISNNLINCFLGNFTCVNQMFNDFSVNTKTINVKDSGDGSLGVDNINSDIILRIPEGNTAPKLGSWATSGANTNLSAKPNRNDALLLEGTNYVDDFTKKGFFTIDFTSATDPDARYVARENPLFSTKITGVVNNQRITVLNPNTLMGFHDDEFIIYRQGYAFASTHYKTVTLNNQRSIGNTLVLDQSIATNDAGSAFFSTSRLHELYISPKRFWFMLEVYNISKSGNNVLPDKSYGYGLIQKDTAPGSTTLGATFNESLYSDTSGDSNIWRIEPSSVGGLIENSKDYGFGKFEKNNEGNTIDLESGAGYIAKYIPQLGYKAITLDGLIQTEKGLLERPDAKISLYMKASDETQGTCAIRTTNYSGTTSDPYFTFYYVDGLPTVDSFTISPNQDDPFYPDFKWSSQDDDLWYGFIILSNKEIKHQYTNAVAVMHLNEVDVSANTGIHLLRYDEGRNGLEVDANELGSGMETTAEGLAGNALKFDAGEDCWVTWADGSYTDPTSEMSIVAHFTCDDISHNGYIVGKYDEFDIYVDTAGKVNATVHPSSSGTAVTLKSTSVVTTDGETPTNVILTLDVGLTSGNVKLFINGKLEDQTGVKNSSGGSHNWTSARNLDNSTGRLTIGIQPASGTTDPSANGFSGTIEEVVIYNKAIYPVIPQDGKYTLTKPIQELSISDIGTGISNVARLFIKDYHNIRGTSTTQVASSSNVSYKKAGLGLKTN